MFECIPKEIFEGTLMKPLGEIPSKVYRRFFLKIPGDLSIFVEKFVEMYF